MFSRSKEKKSFFYPLKRHNIQQMFFSDLISFIFLIFLVLTEETINIEHVLNKEFLEGDDQLIRKWEVLHFQFEWRVFSLQMFHVKCHCSTMITRRRIKTDKRGENHLDPSIERLFSLVRFSLFLLVLFSPSYSTKMSEHFIPLTIVDRWFIFNVVVFLCWWCFFQSTLTIRLVEGDDEFHLIDYWKDAFSPSLFISTNWHFPFAWNYLFKNSFSPSFIELIRI